MKYAVHTLRQQLTKKPRKSAVNTVLQAAYEEIQVQIDYTEYKYCMQCNTGLDAVQSNVEKKLMHQNSELRITYMSSYYLSSFNTFGNFMCV